MTKKQAKEKAKKARVLVPFNTGIRTMKTAKNPSRKSLKNRLDRYGYQQYNGIIEREVKNMTIRELYQWAEYNDALDLDIEIQYRDGGGSYCGVDDAEPIIDIHTHEWNTEKVVLL